MCVPDRCGHQVRGLRAGITKHQTLVAGALIQIIIRGAINALGDIRGLLVVGHQDRATFVIDTVIGVVVADAFDGVACDLDVIDVGSGRDFTGQHDQAGVTQRFGRDTCMGILGKDCIKNRIRHLIGNLIRVTFRHGLRGKEKIV